jgi:predicted acylesterase/phospholipase RssA
MTALVLSAGGMYGAYQAGAWKALADVFHPDLVVGASIGAITGWAIAGGCHPDELVDRWLHLEAASRYRWKFPRSPFHGVFDTTPLQQA